jgi:hypothetical protein
VWEKDTDPQALDLLWKTEFTFVTLELLPSLPLLSTSARSTLRVLGQPVLVELGVQFPLVLRNLSGGTLGRLFLTSVPGFIEEDLPSGGLVLQRRWVAVSPLLCWGLGVFLFATVVREEHNVFRLLQPIREASGRPFAVHNYGIIQL